MMEAINSTPKYQNIEALYSKPTKYLLLMQHASTLLEQQLAERFLPHQQMKVISLAAPNDDAFAQLLNSITDELKQEKAGIHTVIYGDESFLWMVQRCVVQSGCLKEEISLILDESVQPKIKNIYCVHCGHLQRTTEDDHCVCEHCHVALMIRSHFSERLGAYMGVCTNMNQSVGAKV